MSQTDVAAARLEMVEQQLRKRGITDHRVLDAMNRVPRERFASHLASEDAYEDRAWAIACDQTISQPYMVALMTQALELSGGESVLEVGTGSGYQAAVLGELAARVVTIERHAALSAQAATVIAELGYDNIELVVGDGSLGWPACAPYDRIIVTAAAASPPDALVNQLADEGILVLPVGPPECQMLEAIRRCGNRLETTNLSGCRFVPLIGAEGWPE